MNETLDLNISGTQRDIVLKQIPGRFSSIGDYIQVTPTFKHTWATSRHTLIGGS